MREHRCLLNANVHTASKLQADWNKDGQAAFRIEVLEQLPPLANVLLKREREMFWMRKFADDGKLYNAFQTSFSPIPKAIKMGVEAARRPNSIRMKEVWRNPAYRRKRIAQMQAGYERRRKMRGDNIVSAASKDVGS